MISDSRVSLAPGFDEPVAASQRVFRAALRALSHPGSQVAFSVRAHGPSRGNTTGAALLLALLDADCGLWLAPTLADGDAPAWLRFHTGCRIVTEPAEADFAWAGGLDELPALSAFALGTDCAPERSATCIVDVAGFESESPVRRSRSLLMMQGPGIEREACLDVAGWSEAQVRDLEAQWVHNQVLFPRGVDLFLAAPGALVGLPRTTQLRAVAEA